MSVIVVSYLLTELTATLVAKSLMRRISASLASASVLRRRMGRLQLQRALPARIQLTDQEVVSQFDCSPRKRPMRPRPSTTTAATGNTIKNLLAFNAEVPTVSQWDDHEGPQQLGGRASRSPAPSIIFSLGLWHCRGSRLPKARQGGMILLCSFRRLKWEQNLTCATLAL